MATSAQIRHYMSVHSVDKATAKAALATTNNKVALHSDGGHESRRTDDKMGFFVPATEYKFGHPIRTGSVYFEATHQDLLDCRAECDKDKRINSKDKLLSAIGAVFANDKHQETPILANLVLAYYSYTDGYNTGRMMGAKGFVLKVLWEGDRTLLCPSEFTLSSIEQVHKMALDWEDGDEGVRELCQSSLFGHTP